MCPSKVIFTLSSSLSHDKVMSFTVTDLIRLLPFPDVLSRIVKEYTGPHSCSTQLLEKVNNRNISYMYDKLRGSLIIDRPGQESIVIRQNVNRPRMFSVDQDGAALEYTMCFYCQGWYRSEYNCLRCNDYD